MQELLIETTYYGVSLLYILLIILISSGVYAIMFFYLINNYVKIDNMYISKKVINELNNLNKIIDDLIIDKKFLDTINTPMSTVINFKAVNYNVGMVTISLDKVNKTINIISSNCNKTIVLGNHISASEVKYIEDELLKRIPKGK